MNKIRIWFLYLVCLSCLTLQQAGAIESTSLYFLVSALEKAGPPTVVDNYLLLTYRTDNPTGYVAVRFAHENYQTLHVFEYNDYKVYFLLYPLPARLSRLKYRMVIDGIWMADPGNPYWEADLLGIPHSIYDLSEVRPEDQVSPVVKGREVTFYFRYSSGRAVYVAGDFNAFDPYLYRLRELSPGEYGLTLQMPPGEHGYYYVVDGYRYIDPLNPYRKLDSYAQEVSIFKVK